MIIVALVSGCGIQAQNGGGSSKGRKVLSKAEIQELTDLLVVDAEEDVDYEDAIPDNSDSDTNSHFTYVWDYKEEEDSVEKILTQVSEDQKILQECSEDELALHP